MSGTETRRIVLVGFMGAGKSTVGPLLADLLGFTFRDLDRVLEDRLGRTIAEVFQAEGEAFFREQERRLAEEGAGWKDTVVAAGGGAFAFPATRAALQRGAFTAWLRAPVSVLSSRIVLDGSRPLANHETMRAMLADRESSYALADLTVDTSEGTAAAAARAIADAFLARNRHA